MPSAWFGSMKTVSSSPSRCRSWKAKSSREAPIPNSVPRRWTISLSLSGWSGITCAVLAANTMGHGCCAGTAGNGWVRRADMAGPDLPGPREPCTAAHLQRWPMGAERTELLDGQLYWPGDFDERDAMVARRAWPGSRIRVEPGVGLIAGPVPEAEPESREWADEDGTRWHEMNGMTLYQRSGERNWTMRPPTREGRRHNTEEVAADRAEGWARTGAAVAETTWEEAIVALAAKVRQRYGDDRARVPGQSAR